MVFSFKPSHQFTVVKQLDRFDFDVAQKPFFILLSELFNFIRNHLHLKFPMEVGVIVNLRFKYAEALKYFSLFVPG